MGSCSTKPLQEYLRRVIGLFAILTAAAFAPTAIAQDEDPDDGIAGEVEEMVVTGTYIKGTPEDAPLPVTTLQRDDLALEGAPTAIDLIKSLSFSQGADGETDQFQAGAGADRATINIRGLGPSRSLVLLNGRRTTWSPHAIGAQAQLLVDVNMLPSIALQRIEVLRDGAAATYGSDAIAGVMNYITRGDFEGFEVSASHKTVADADGDTEFGLIWGGSLLDGRLQLMTSASYIDRGELNIANRDWSLLDYADSPAGGWSSVGRPAVFVPLDRWQASPIGGGFGGLLATGITDPNCEDLGGARTSTLNIPFPDSAALGNGDPGIGGFCRFQYTAFDNLIEDATRWQWFTEATVAVNDTTALSLELLMTDSDVPHWGTSPSYPPNRLVDETRTIRANNPGLVDMASKYPQIYGGYAHCDADYCRWQGDGGAQDEAGIPAAWQDVGWYYGRYYGQDGPRRGHHRTSEVQRFAAALDGEWGARTWEMSLSYSQSKRESAGGDTMVYRDARARQGLGGHECERMVPNEYNDQGQLAFSLATVQQHAGQGPCQYWIPFSNAMPGSHPFVNNGEASNPDFNPALNNQNLHDYIMTYGVGKGETSLWVLEGILTGSLDFAQLAGGTVEYAAGLQYRSETYESGVDDSDFFNGVTFPCAAGPEIKDCETGRTGLFGFLPPSFPIDDERNIWSAFAEFRLPLSDTLEGSLSMRHENYGGNTGASTDPKIALRWQITPSIGVRTSFGTTFRGPTLNQTVASNSSNSLQFVGSTGAFKRIDTRGNPDLTPEAATTINVGLLVDRDGLIADSDNLFVTLDYWSYDFEDPLVTEPFANVLSLACPGGATDPCDPSSPYYGRLVFGGNPAAADVEIINVDIVNGPDIKTDGIDFRVRYGLDAGPGYLSLDLSGTRITSYDISEWEFGADYDALGRLNYRTPLARTLAEWKGRLSANYAWGAMNTRWVVNGIDEYDYLMQGFGVEGVVASHVTHDMHIHYSFMNDQLRAIFSVFNIEDENPPFMSREMNYDAFTHNPFGRMFKVGLTYTLSN